MKKTITTFVALVLVLSAFGCGKKASLEGGNKALVSFNDTKLNITTNDLYEELKEKYGTNILIDMIDTKIFSKEYPDSDEINDYSKTQLDSLKNYYEDDSKFLEYINSYGYKDEDELMDYFKLNYRRNLAVYDYLKTVIKDSDIENYYNNKVMGDITGSHILFEVNITDSMTEEEKRNAKESAQKKAKEALEKLNNGTSFADVAKEYSDDTATKNKGGKMGTFSATKLDDVTRQAYQKLKVGEYTKEAIETEYGYEIFLKEEEAEKPKLEEVKSYILKTLSDEKLTADSKLQYEALKYFREKYGFKISDEDLQVYYDNTMKNLMASE